MQLTCLLDFIHCQLKGCYFVISDDVAECGPNKFWVYSSATRKFTSCFQGDKIAARGFPKEKSQLHKIPPFLFTLLFSSFFPFSFLLPPFPLSPSPFLPSFTLSLSFHFPHFLFPPFYFPSPFPLLSSPKRPSKRSGERC